MVPSQTVLKVESDGPVLQIGSPRRGAQHGGLVGAFAFDYYAKGF